MAVQYILQEGVKRIKYTGLRGGRGGGVQKGNGFCILSLSLRQVTKKYREEKKYVYLTYLFREDILYNKMDRKGVEWQKD